MHYGLLYLCAFTGLIIVVGSFLLIWKGRILINSKGGTISEIQLPLGFRVKTQLPVVVMFFFGAFLLTLPIILVRSSFDEVQTVQLTGKIQSNQRRAVPYKAYAMAADCDASNEVKLVVPYVKNSNYKVLYYDNTGFVFDEYIDWSKVVDGRYELKEFQVINVDASGTNSPGVSAPVLSTEPRATVDSFK